ncbi:aldehyde dehydrogenase family protein [Cupriavidus basilensis]
MLYDRFYSRGEFQYCTGPTQFPVYNPTTETQESVVKTCSDEDLEAAIASAMAGFEAWSCSSIEERHRVLVNLEEGLAQRATRIADSLAREIGCPVWLGALMQVPMALKGIQFAREGLFELKWTEQIGNGLVERVPVGVIAAITPWNFPLHQIVAKVAPAIAAGCSVVLKPSELAPGAAQLFMEAVHESGLPSGVVNMVWGGPELGEQLVSHPAIQQVSFTGSTAVGKKIMTAAAKQLKRTTLELGGKSAAVVLPDADLDTALPVVLRMSSVNSGQACVSQSRLLVPESLLSEVEAKLTSLVAMWPLGDPLDPATRLGPVANARQHERVTTMVEAALSQGARLLTGGPGRPEGKEKGWFCPITILSDVQPDMEIAQEEVFGPVLVILRYKSEAEAIALANGTKYGLSGAVWAGSPETATSFARNLKTGQVIINGAAQNLATPFGGWGESGVGRENGRFGIEECLSYRSLHGAH